MEENIDFDAMRDDYKKFKTKYNLPDFEKLAEDFDIEKDDEKRTSFVLRDIRKSITEKISSCFQFFEILINPSSPPSFIFSFLRNMTPEDKKEIKEIHKELVELEIEILKRDTVYNEELEAKFIKKSFEKWQEIKLRISKILDKIDKSSGALNNSKTSGYFM